MLRSLRILARPVWCIVRNAVFVEVVVLLLLLVVGRAAKWETPDYSFVLFIGGIFILIMPGFSASQSRYHPGIFGWGASRHINYVPSVPAQLLLKNMLTGMNDDAMSGLAGLLQNYGGSVSIALAGIGILLIGIMPGN